MKKLFNMRKSKMLLFTLLAMIVGGVSPAWADTGDTTFDDVTIVDGTVSYGTTTGTKLSNNWLVQGGNISDNESGSYNIRASYKRGDDGKAIDASASSSQSAYLITPSMSGEVTFYFRSTTSSSSSAWAINVYEATEEGESYSIGTTDLIPSSVTHSGKGTFNWTKVTISNVEDKHLAFKFSRVAIDDFTGTLYVDGAVKKPKNLAVADGITYNSATLTWTAGGEETDWQVAYGTTADFDADAASKYDVTSATYTMTGLTAETTYYACVRAKVGEEFSAWTNKVSFTTPERYAKPSNLTIAKQGSSVTLGWTAGGDETAWEVVYSDNSSEDPDNLTVTEVNTATCTLNGLTAGSTYYVWVRAKFGSGSDEHSDWLTGSVSLAYSTPAPTSVDGSGITNVSFGIGTETVNSSSRPTSSPYYGDYSSQIGGVVPGTTANVDITFSTGYDYGTVIWVDWNQNYEFEGDEVVYVGTSKNSNPTTLNASFNVIGTQSMGYYRMRIAAADSYYNSYTSSIAAAASANPIPTGTYTVVHDYTLHVMEAPSVMSPSALISTSVTATTVTLAWTDGEEGLSAWEIKYSTDVDFDPATEGTAVEANANPFTLTKLTAETTYYAYVRAKKGEDYSDWSNKVEFMPTASVTLTVNDGTQTSSYVPVYGMYVDNFDKVEFIIPASSIDEVDGGTIKGLTFYLSSPAEVSWGAANFKVYMKEVDETIISAFNFTDTDVALYDGSLDGTQPTMKVNFTTPYVYNGGNLLIGFYNTVKGTYKSASFYGVSAESGASVYGNNGTSLTSVTSVNKQSFLPKTTFTYLPGTPKAKMVVTPTAIDFGTLSQNSEATAFTQTFTISNTSTKVDLTDLAETCNGEGYTVSALPRTTIATEGENAEAIELTVTFAPTTDKTYDGTITVTGSDDNKATITLTGVYSNTAATMSVTDAENNDVNGTTIDFGSKGKSVTKTFTVTNDGDLTLSASIASDNTDFFTVTPAALEVAGHSSETFDVTFVWANSDLDTEKTATITLTGGELSQSFTVKGTCVEMWSEDFADDPTVSRGWEADASDSYGWIFVNGVAKSSRYNGSSYYLTTPQLRVENSTDELTFEYIPTSSWATFKIEMSKDGSSFTTYATVPDGTSIENGVTYSYTITGLEAGIYKFRFNDCYFSLDNFEGFKLYIPEHDGKITAETIPATGYQNQVYTATVTVEEKAGKKEQNVVATLYIGENAVATSDAQTLAAKGTATFTMSFTPTEAMSGTAKVVVTNGNLTVNSSEVSVSIKTVITYDETTTNDIAYGFNQNIMLKRTYSKGWNTICLPFSVTYPNTVESFFGTGVKAYEFNSYDAESGLGFKQVTEMNYNKPYLLYIPSTVNVDELAEMFLTDQYIPIANPTAETVKGNVTFHGTYSPMAAGSLTDNYVLSNQAKIAKASDKASLKAFRAYFTTTGEARMTITFDDGTQGIAVMTTDGELEVGSMYNLQGQKVQGDRKGLYIINGKKVVRK